MMQDKLIEALQEIIEVASGKCQVAEDDTEGMAWIDKRARAAVRAHDAGTDEGLPTDRRPCPNCGRSDGWHYALGHPPLPVGDCRKIVWMRDKDEMEWWGVRAYNHAEGYWQSNSREESSTVLFWMETPHSPHYPPASHAESVPVAKFRHHPDALIDAQVEIDRLEGHLKTATTVLNDALCLDVVTPKAVRVKGNIRWALGEITDDAAMKAVAPRFVSTAQLDAEDQHRAAEPGEEEMGRAYGMVTVEEADAELADRRTK